MLQGVPEDHRVKAVFLVGRGQEVSGDDVEAEALPGVPGRRLGQLHPVRLVAQRAQVIQHDAPSATDIEDRAARNAPVQDPGAPLAKHPGQRLEERQPFHRGVRGHVLRGDGGQPGEPDPDVRREEQEEEEEE